jgi:cytochrome bd-type quinol oxidase subunit 2
MEFVHPALGAAVILYSVWIMSRGLAARQGGKGAHQARRTHKKWAWYALWGMVLAALTGIGSTLWLRPDLELGETWHLAIGLVCVGLMGLAALLTRYFTHNAQLRQVHPWIGIAAVVLGIAQAIVGIELLP